MSSEKMQNLQDTFLNFVRKNKVPLTFISLENGVKLQGIVTWFDNFCLLLRRGGPFPARQQARYFDNQPGHQVQMFEPSRKTEKNQGN